MTLRFYPARSSAPSFEPSFDCEPEQYIKPRTSKFILLGSLILTAQLSTDILSGHALKSHYDKDYGLERSIKDLRRKTRKRRRIIGIEI